MELVECDIDHLRPVHLNSPGALHVVIVCAHAIQWNCNCAIIARLQANITL